MSAATEPRLTQRTRWSAAAKCPRWAALGGLGFEPEEPEEQTRLYWQRGKVLGRFVADQYAAKYGEDGIVREKAVAWSAGILHPDLFIRAEGWPVEVKSTTAPASVLDDALLQLAGQIHFDPDADEFGVLDLIDPSTFRRRPMPMKLTPALREAVEARANEIVRALATKGEDMPDCVCAKPGECRSKGCPFTAVAWEGWQPPPPTPLDDEGSKLLSALFQAEQLVKTGAATVEMHKGERDEIRERLRPHIEPGIEYTAEGVKLKLIAVKPRETYDIRAALKAGIVSEELIAPFRKVGAGHDRWDLRVADNWPTPSTTDFGDTPF